jgi:hypothetical protein
LGWEPDEDKFPNDMFGDEDYSLSEGLSEGLVDEKCDCCDDASLSSYGAEDDGVVYDLDDEPYEEDYFEDEDDEVNVDESSKKSLFTECKKARQFKFGQSLKFDESKSPFEAGVKFKIEPYELRPISVKELNETREIYKDDYPCILCEMERDL